MDVNVTPGFPLTGIDKEAAEKAIGDTTGMSDQEIKDAILEYMANHPTNSAGRIVTDNQKARTENAPTQNPQPAHESWWDDAFSDIPSANDAKAIDSATGRFKPNNTPLPIKKDAGSNSSDTNVDGPGTSNNVGSESATISNKEETIRPSNSTENGTVIAGEFKQQIKAKENPFKQFGSYTYSVSMYMMGAEEYATMISTGKKSVKGLPLIMQSGGINNTDPSGNFGAVRSAAFNLDFYIDDIEFKGLISGTGNGSAHNTFEMSFKVTEPNGLSFLDRLHKMVKDYNLVKGVSKDRINYASQNYLMVVRFYGYDQEGNAVSAKDLGSNVDISDMSAVAEKFIPFQFTEIKFAIRNELVEYQCRAVCPQTHIPKNVANADIPFNVELEGQSLRELCGSTTNALDVLRSAGYGGLNREVVEDSGGDTTQNLATEEAKDRIVTRGLVDALNQEQERLVERKTVEQANIYEIKFEETEDGYSIGNEKVAQMGGFTALADTPMQNNYHRERAVDKYLSSKKFVNNDKKIFSVPAGTKITEFIDLVVRTSTYITNQQTIIVDDQGNVSKRTPNSVFQWFKIRTQIKPLKYDNKRHDYAYKITYVVTRYFVNDIQAENFSASTYRGVHKEYDYWFTGKNTEVLNFEQEYNYLYFQTMGAQEPVVARQNNARELTKRYYLPGNAEGSIGSKGGSNESADNAASILYSPSDQANARVQIVGDPDWIAQSEIFYGPEVALKEIGLGPFMQDGSVNYDASEVLFSINYNTNQDYNLLNGIAEVGKDNYGRQVASGIPGESRMSLIYRANIITSNLSKGKFTQQLEGTLMLFPTEEQREKQKAEKERYAITSTDADGTVHWGDHASDPKKADDNRKNTLDLMASQEEKRLAREKQEDAEDIAYTYGTDVNSQQSKMLADQDSGWDD